MKINLEDLELALDKIKEDSKSIDLSIFIIDHHLEIHYIDRVDRQVKIKLFRSDISPRTIAKIIKEENL